MRVFRKKTVLAFICILLGILIVSCDDGSGSSDKMSKSEMLEDFDYLMNILEKNYPGFETFERLNGFDWRDKKNIYREAVSDVKSDKEFFELMFTVFGYELGYLFHAGIMSPSFYNEHCDAFESFAAEFPDYPQLFAPWVDILQNEDVKKKYEYWASLLNVESKYGSRSAKKSYPVYYGCKDTKAMPSTSGLTCEVLEPGKIAYIKCPTFAAQKTDDLKTVLDFYSKNGVKDFESVIIDLRGNGGGDDYYGLTVLMDPLTENLDDTSFYITWKDNELFKKFYDPMFKLPFSVAEDIDNQRIVEELSYIDIADLPSGLDYPDEISANHKYAAQIKYYLNSSPGNPIGFTGDIYVLVDEYVYSASETFTMLAKASGWATIVGTRTGGDGVGFTPVIVTLPNSKLIYRFSNFMSLNPDGTCNEEVGTIPDVQIGSKENALDKALEIINSAK
ncbi:MAG: hypothetical protein JXK07_15865 [Spirochaetes bacterium]|nr:hypothetical protein [Spirochaetota bacterium]MBN2770754.1 hypothetical protein [Spirochaetota bacterium]